MDVDEERVRPQPWYLTGERFARRSVTIESGPRNRQVRAECNAKHAKGGT